jgi:hypothetical protein
VTGTSLSPIVAKYSFANASAVVSLVVITSKCKRPFLPFTYVSYTCTVSG